MEARGAACLSVCPPVPERPRSLLTLLRAVSSSRAVPELPAALRSFCPRPSRGRDRGRRTWLLSGFWQSKV